MKHFLKHKDKAMSLISDDENYIIFNDGKPIRQNILIEDSLDIDLDNRFDPCELFDIKRSKCECEISRKANFNVSLDIYKDIDLKLIYLNDDEENLAFSFEIERNLNVKITNIIVSIEIPTGSNRIETNMLFDYNLNDDAKVVVTNFSNIETKTNVFYNYYLDNKSFIEVNNLNIDDCEIKSLSNVYLYEEKGSAKINNSSINTSNTVQAYNYIINHLVGKTKSELTSYGVVKNNSSLNMDTNGIIKNGASKTELYQKSKGIILDLESSITASPWLQIDEFDVKASHGASIGAIDESDLFYLMSRGLPKDLSESIIINGFFNPFLSKINDEKILKYIQEIITKHLN